MAARFEGSGSDYAFVLVWLRQFGAALSKGHRQRVDALPDGRATLTVEYPSLGHLLEVLQQIDALIAMVAEDAGAREEK